MILSNAFIYTGDADHRCIPDGAMVIEGGRITWIGPAAELPSGSVVRDLGGMVVMPGMVNTHAHGGLSLHRGVSDEGSLFEWMRGTSPNTSVLTVEDNRWGCYLALFEQVRHGITMTCDCTRYGAGVFAEVASEIGVRSLAGALANSPGLRAAGRPNWPLALEETEAAMAVDTGGLARFYLGAHSPYNCTPELLQEVAAAGRARNLPFVIHAAETRREVEIIRERWGMRPVQWLHHLGVLGPGAVLAHCVWLDEIEIAMLAEAGCGVAHNPVSNGKLASGVAPVRALRAAGVPVGLGTDSTLSNNAQSLFQEMKTFIILQRTQHLDGYAATATDALAMATLEGARVLSWDAECGSLEVGKQADLVMLDLDHPLGLTPARVMSDLVYAAGPQHVREVMVAGRTVFADGRFANVDEAAIKAEIKRRYAAQ